MNPEINRESIIFQPYIFIQAAAPPSSHTQEHLEKQKDEIWPEMSDALVRTGWRNYTIFFREDGTLFGYVECDESFEASLEGMSKEEVNQRWQDDMSPTDFCDTEDALSGTEVKKWPYV